MRSNTQPQNIYPIRLAELDASFVREVKEETGITILPGDSIGTWNRIYKKGDDDKQIIALVRLAYYKSGEIT